MGKGPKSTAVPLPKKTEKAPLPHSSSNWLILVGLGAVLAIILALGVGWQSPGPPSETKVESKTATKSVPTEASNEVVDYDSFVRAAKINGWQPSDPVERLKSSIQKYGQAFEGSVEKCNGQPPSSSGMDLLAALKADVGFILRALANSPYKTLDLTELFFSSLDTSQRFLFKAMKETLTHCSSKMTTRMSIEQLFVDDLYYPSQSLLGFVQYRQQLESEGKTYHISIDLTNPAGKSSLPALAYATQLRLHRLLPIIAGLGASTTGALHEAILNGDDLSTAILLSSGVEPQSVSTLSAHKHLPDTLTLCHQLNYTHICARLEQMIRLSRAAVEGNLKQEQRMLAVNEFAATKPHSDLFSHSSDLIHGEEKSTGSFRDLHLLRSMRSQGDASSEGVSHSPSHPLAGLASSLSQFPLCRMDQVELGQLSPHDFESKYLRTNTPVALIRGDPADFGVSNIDDWSKEALAIGGRKKMVSVSEIPYGDVFGSTKVKQSVKSFIHDLNHCTEELECWIEDDKDSRRCEDISSKKSCLGLQQPPHFPTYVFGDQGEIVPHLELPATAPLTAIMHTASNYSKTHPSSSATDAIGAGVWKMQFYLGSALSGAPFHSHGPAFNTLVHGKKLWWLLPPARDVYSAQHPLGWLRKGGVNQSSYPYKPSEESSPLSGPCVVVQDAGDVLFVPRHWSHQILNLAESVGFAIEILDYI